MQSDSATPEHVVQAQLDAYNARDLKAFAATYALNAEQFAFPNTLLATGRDAIAARYVERFNDTSLHAELLNRLVMGNTVVDYERVRMLLPEGPSDMEIMCVYEIVAGTISRAVFQRGPVTRV